MAHKTLIDGTAYGISGGKTLIDGTAFSIKGGKTLVDGTAYEVGLAQNAIITITGDSNYTSVVIDGVTYNTATTVEVPIGTVITCVTQNSNYGGSIKLNYKSVASATSGSGVQYEYTVVSDATIKFGTTDQSGYGYTLAGEILIVDENAPVGYTVTISTTGGYISGAAVKIDGLGYSSERSVEVCAGTVITCSAQYQQGSGGDIVLNGEVVVSRPDQSSLGSTTYEYTVVSDVQIIIGKYRNQTGPSSYKVYGTITITEL